MEGALHRAGRVVQGVVQDFQMEEGGVAMYMVQRPDSADISHVQMHSAAPDEH